MGIGEVRFQYVVHWWPWYIKKMHYAIISAFVYVLKFPIIKNKFLKVKCSVFRFRGRPFTPSSCRTNHGLSFNGQIWRLVALPSHQLCA